MDQFLIGDILIRWECGDYTLRRGEFMEKFRFSGLWEGKTVTLTGKVEPLEPYTHYPLLRSETLYDIYDVEGERLCLYHWSYLKLGYAVWPDRISRGESHFCSFDPAMNSQLPMDMDWFFGVCGLHKAFLRQSCPILHASYVDIGGQALLFTAPSETGKSTQAALWCAHSGAELINGDRVLLGEKDGIWYAYGYPNCGSSAVCINRTLPIRGIVVLQQGQENRVEQLSMPQKIRALTAGMVLYPWDGEDLSLGLSAAADIANTTQILRLVCRPDRGAVETLKQFLEEVFL